jgi:hypothetical protein
MQMQIIIPQFIVHAILLLITGCAFKNNNCPPQEAVELPDSTISISNTVSISKALHRRWPVERLYSFTLLNNPIELSLEAQMEHTRFKIPEPGSSRLMHTGNAFGLIAFFEVVPLLNKIEGYTLSIYDSNKLWTVESGPLNLLLQPPRMRGLFGSKTLSEELSYFGIPRKSPRPAKSTGEWQPWETPVFGREDLREALESRWSVELLLQFCERETPLTHEMFLKKTANFINSAQEMWAGGDLFSGQLFDLNGTEIRFAWSADASGGVLRRYRIFAYNGYKTFEGSMVLKKVWIIEDGDQGALLQPPN